MQNKKAIVFLILITILLTIGILNYNSLRKIGTTNNSQTIYTKFGISFPPVQNQQQIDFTINHMKELNLKSVRMDAPWENREPTKGEFYWTPLDKRINSFNENDISVLITIPADGPEWACNGIRNENSCIFNDKEEFRTFIQELVKRYSNKIDKIQFGNEWDIEWRFIGTGEQFTEYANIVYDETKKYSPETKVVLGGFTRTVPTYLLVCETEKNNLKFPLYSNAGEKIITEEKAKELCSYRDSQEKVNYVLENARYDLIDLHLYDETENFDDYYNALKTIVNVPVIVTEFGIQEGFTPEYAETKNHAEQIKEAFQKINNLGVSEAYYFNLVDGADGPHKKSGLIYLDTLKEKQAYFEVKKFLTP